MIMGLSKLHFVDSSLALDQWRTLAYLAPLSDDGSAASVERSAIQRRSQTTAAEGSRRRRGIRRAAGGGHAREFLRRVGQGAWPRICTKAPAPTCWSATALKASSAPDQSEGDFRAQLTQRAREQSDAAVEALRKKYAPKIATLDDRARRAQERIDREKSQLSQQKLQTAFSVGASVLGALFGRKAMSASNVNRAASAARSASRIGRESGDVDRADDNLEAVQQQRADLQKQFEADTAATGARDGCRRARRCARCR